MLKYMPTLGWAWWFAGYGFVKRNWKKDESEMIKVLTALKKQVVPFTVSILSYYDLIDMIDQLKC